MAKHNENDYVIPALMVLYHHARHATMSVIKDEVGKYIELNEEDLAAFESRRTRKEACYRQVVGNIVSHHNKRFFTYAEHDDPKGPYPRGSLWLNDKGVIFVEQLISSDSDIDRVDYVINTSTVDETDERTPDISEVDNKLIQFAESNGLDKRPATDQKLKATILEICGYECQYGMLIGEHHKTFIASDGKPYVVGHHLIPMSARKDFFPRNLDRASNIVCLCSGCHDLIHHGNKEDRIRILKVLYERYIETLNDEQIYISFNDLVDKYYSMKGDDE